jgi:protein O-GlcNAc transferase
VTALNELSVALHRVGRLEEALEMARRAFAIRPDEVEAMDHIAVVLRSMDRRVEAIEFYRRAIALRPERAVLHNNLGALLKEMNQVTEAIACFRRALELDAKLAEAHNNLGVALKDQGRLDEAMACYDRALGILKNHPDVESNRIYTMHFHPGYDAGAIGAALGEFNRKWRREIGGWSNDRSQNRRLRIGYVSPDFREHVVGWNILPVLEEHDHQGFEIFCYSDVRRADGVTERIRACADVWRAMAGKTDDEAAAMVRTDGIDLLVDLTLHMNGNRLMLFARKPAPIQVTYLGYCGSTGLEAVDYRFSDFYLDPLGTDGNYVEKTIRLPTSYWCYRPGGKTPEVAGLPDEIVFACMNNFCKVSGAAMALWGEILAALPGAKLMIHSQPGEHLDAVRRKFGKAVEFVGMQGIEEYFAAYGRAAISLDPFPYWGGITTCDSLWMGVPVVTLAGRMPIGRAGVTLLSQVGLTELIAETPEEYVRISVELARDRGRLEELRRTLRERMRASPLMDARRLARDIEGAYRAMWTIWINQ